MTSAVASNVAMAASEKIARILATKRLLNSVNVADLSRTLCLRELDTAVAHTDVFPHLPASLAMHREFASPQLEAGVQYYSKLLALTRPLSMSMSRRVGRVCAIFLMLHPLAVAPFTARPMNLFAAPALRRYSFAAKGADGEELHKHVIALA